MLPFGDRPRAVPEHRVRFQRCVGPHVWTLPLLPVTQPTTQRILSAVSLRRQSKAIPKPGGKSGAGRLLRFARNDMRGRLRGRLSGDSCGAHPVTGPFLCLSRTQRSQELRFVAV
jgi:hypothetical protein